MPTRVRILLPATLCAWLSFGSAASAHHDPPGEPLYDASNPVELAGVITEVFWRNPHVRFRIAVSAGAAVGEIWELEMSPINLLARARLDADVLPVDERVRVLGPVSRRNPRHVAVNNLLLPNGFEYAGRGTSRSLQFSDRRLSIEALPIAQAAIETAERDAEGIFRVWASGPEYGVGSSRPRHADSLLTEAALAATATFDPGTDPIIDCAVEGMPRGMLHPSSVKFIDEGERILPLVQEHDLVRTIYMRDAADPAQQPATSLGYSIGRSDGATLVVETTRIDWPYSYSDGTPKATSRFTSSGSRCRPMRRS